jgi:hypothetical protein|tara:strand:+ start:1018 stop:1914 length:897 start_codon:yes stop_codon:yes gene_type:complete
MSTYKPFTTSDVVVTPFKVNKSFTFQGASAITASNVGIDRFIGKNIESTLWVSGSNSTGQINPKNKELVYDSIKQLYYSNYLLGEDGSPAFTASFNTDGTITGGGGTKQPSYFNYLSNTLDANRHFPTGSNERIGVISIPSNLFGEYIKPGTFSLITPNNTITDDGEGGIYSASLKIGDIIYPHGIAIFTSASVDKLDEIITGSNITCSFQSTSTIFESQYKCTLNENEFNFSNNPSVISGSSTGTVYDFITGSYFEPYITTVGLYNNANELVAVGKLSQPLQSSNTTDTTILVNLDL